jgi:AraC-like DNA-binding protein
MFSEEFLSEPLLYELEKVERPLCATVGIDEWDDMIKMLRKIYKEFKESSDDKLSQIYIRANVENLCIFLLRNQKAENYMKIQVSQEPIRKAVSFIQKNYRSPIHLSDAANAACLSSTYFSMVFHSTMGITFSEYLVEYRLQIAERYLRSSNLPIKQIAVVCGFSSYPYFVTKFKEYFGFPPGSWRTKLQKQQ